MRKLYQIFCLVVLVGLLAGCSSTPEPEETVQESALEETPETPPIEQASEHAVEPELQPAGTKETAPVDKAPDKVEVEKAPDKVEKEKKVETKPAGPHPALTNPSLANETAPENFQVQFETTQGEVVIEVNRSWAPRGADRFYNLVKIGYFQEIAFFRVIDRFMAQFGLHGDPAVTGAWRSAQIQDDPVTQSNTRGFISFATAGPNTRTTQLFINFGDNSMLDGQGFAPFGRVITGMEAIDSLYKGYGEGAPRGQGPSQGVITQQGNDYLKSQFPKLDYIKRATLLP